MKKIQIAKISDPGDAPPRNPLMMGYVDAALAEVEPAFRQPPRANCTRVLRARPETGHKAGADDWVAEMLLIRDDRCQTSFAAIFGHFAPRLKAFLIRSGLTPAVSEDLVQDIMQTVWRKADMFDPRRASVATWLFTIARNRRIDFLRKHARPEPEDLPWGPEAEPDQAEVIGLKQESDVLRQALRELPEKQRVLVEKAYFGDLTHTEIAAETGLPLGTIKSRIRLALDRLRHAMSS